jgi:hypothetical protein
MTKDQPIDRLEDEWLRLGALIKQREAELVALKKTFDILDQARAVILQRSVKSHANVPTRVPKLGLRAAVLAVVQKSEFGLPITSLCDAVAANIEIDRYSSLRSLQAAVLTTARRLVTDGELKMVAIDGKPCYIPSSESTDPDVDLSQDVHERDAR